MESEFKNIRIGGKTVNIIVKNFMYMSVSKCYALTQSKDIEDLRKMWN
jgi:hypothetical protein